MMPARSRRNAPFLSTSQRLLAAASLYAGLVTALAPGDARADARYLQLDELVREAEVIAVVDTAWIEETSTKGEHWTYGQDVRAARRILLKGAMARVEHILAEKDFQCAKARYAPMSRYLVFLRRDAVTGSLVTVNHGAGNLLVHEVDEDHDGEPDQDPTVMWNYGEQRGQRPLADVLTELRGMIPPPPPLGPALLALAAPPPAAEPAAAPNDAPACTREDDDGDDGDDDELWSPARELAGGALAVLLGFVTGSRRRRPPAARD